MAIAFDENIKLKVKFGFAKILKESNSAIPWMHKKLKFYWIEKSEPLIIGQGLFAIMNL